jgi:hypothetical protein
MKGAAMRNLIGLGGLSALLCVSGCDVQIHDTTPAQFQANNDIGMYQVSATAEGGALVAPGSVVMFAIGDNQRVPLAPGPNGYSGLYSVRCASSFPLQILAIWRLQGLATRQKLVPPQPRQIKLTEPPLTPQAGFDTSTAPSAAAATPAKSARGKARRGKAAREEWQGTVDYKFVTTPLTEITAAHIEPSSAAPADVAAARAIAVTTPLPLQAPCGENAELHLASTERRSHGVLVIDTDNPGQPHWRTDVEFTPK